MPTLTELRAASTSATTRATYNLGRLYVAFGDAIAPLIQGIDWEALDRTPGRSGAQVRVLALVTLFQYVEGLADVEAVDALQTRMDWKYALHVPIDHPGLATPSELSKFRENVRRNPSGLAILQDLLKQMVEVGLLKVEGTAVPEISVVLKATSALCRMREVANAVDLALQALAATYPDWLRTINLPHWYIRYERARASQRFPVARAEQQQMLTALEADAAYLLKAVHEGGDPVMATLPEMQTLARIQHEACPAPGFGPGSYEP